jgi:hypothetical protein
MPYTLTAPLSLTLNDSAPALFLCPAWRSNSAMRASNSSLLGSAINIFNPNSLHLFNTDFVVETGRARRQIGLAATLEAFTVAASILILALSQKPNHTAGLPAITQRRHERTKMNLTDRHTICRCHLPMRPGNFVPGARLRRVAAASRLASSPARTSTSRKCHQHLLLLSFAVKSRSSAFGDRFCN